MTSDASPFHFPVSAGVVAGGGFGIELGALVTGMELSTRTEEVGGHGLGGLVFVVFLLGWAAAFLGASAFLMRWTTGHRVVAIGLGLGGIVAAVLAFIDAPSFSSAIVLAGSGALVLGGIRWPAEPVSGPRLARPPRGGRTADSPDSSTDAARPKGV
jgi:hypothetical protein